MVGDIGVRFIIHGHSGNTITLTREEAERCLAALARALNRTGPETQVIETRKP
jgi:hypothetical protein